MAEPLMSVKEVAAFLNVNQMTVYRAVSTGTLNHVRVGRSIRFRREDIDAFLAGPKPTAPAEQPRRTIVTRL